MTKAKKKVMSKKKYSRSSAKALKSSYSFGGKISAMLVGFVLFGVFFGGYLLISSRAAIDCSKPFETSYTNECWLQSAASGKAGDLLTCAVAQGAAKGCNNEKANVYVCADYLGKPHDMIVPKDFPIFYGIDSTDERDLMNEFCKTRRKGNDYLDACLGQYGYTQPAGVFAYTQCGRDSNGNFVSYPYGEPRTDAQLSSEDKASRTPKASALYCQGMENFDIRKGQVAQKWYGCHRSQMARCLASTQLMNGSIAGCNRIEDESNEVLKNGEARKAGKNKFGRFYTIGWTNGGKALSGGYAGDFIDATFCDTARTIIAMNNNPENCSETDVVWPDKMGIKGIPAFGASEYGDNAEVVDLLKNPHISCESVSHAGYADYGYTSDSTSIDYSIRFKNTGTTSWVPSTGYKAVAVGVDAKRFGATEIPLTGSVAPGNDIILRTRLTLPATDGLYRMVFMMQNDKGQTFGSTGWCDEQRVPDTPLTNPQGFRPRIVTGGDNRLNTNWFGPAMYNAGVVPVFNTPLTKPQVPVRPLGQ